MNLVTENLPLVRQIAFDVSLRVPAWIAELDDLVAYGCIGLIDASMKFKPELGHKFKTYAQHRIRGSVIDGLRMMDPLSRGDRRTADRIRHEDISDHEPVTTITPEDHVIATAERAALSEALSFLAERERMMVTLYYWERYTLHEIGDLYGITEAAVSKTLLRARKEIARWISYQ